MYILQWRTPSIDANKNTPIQVPVGSVVSNKASIRFTGKGAPGYGAIQQENLMRLLENSAGPTPPLYPTTGETWFDSEAGILKLCAATSPVVWKSLAGIQITNVGEPAPTPAVVGDMWFQRTGSSSGVLYTYTGIGRHPVTAGVIGGWNQVWPLVEITAGREEYNNVMDALTQIIGPTSAGGSGAIGKAVTGLTDFAALDASMVAAFNARTPQDTNVVTPVTGTTELLVDPTSNDWDMVLAAVKYAVNRLELPAGFVADVSPVPFVTDGRQAPAALTSLDPTDLRYPSLERRSNRRFGSVTLHRVYAETVNVLNATLANRYSIKGINGATGTNPAFATTTDVVHHVQFGGALGGLSTASIGLRYTFANQEARDSFLYSGGALQLTMTHVPGGTGTAADTDLKTLLDSRGVLRLTADKTRIFSNVLPLTLSAAPISAGIKGAPAGGQVLTTQTVGGASYTINVGLATATTINVFVQFTSSGAMNGTLIIKYDDIKSNETYTAPTVTPVYGAPAAYATGDKYTGTPALVFMF